MSLAFVIYTCIEIIIFVATGLSAQLLSTSLSEVCGSIPGSVKSDAVSHRCDVSLEQCCPDPKPRKWDPLSYTLRRSTASMMKI